MCGLPGYYSINEALFIGFYNKNHPGTLGDRRLFTFVNKAFDMNSHSIVTADKNFEISIRNHSSVGETAKVTLTGLLLSTCFTLNINFN